MRFQIALLLAVILIVSPLLPVFSRTPLAGFQQDERLRISSTEVQLDVIVRDKRGRAVADLKRDDFEVLEDGVRQPIESFRLVTRSSGHSGKETETTAAPTTDRTVAADKKADPDVGVSVVALVFDRLSTDARKRAMDAALSYVGENANLSSFVGVFAINLSLNTLQNYTTDIALVKRAVERAGSLASSSFEAAQVAPGSAESAGQRAAALVAAENAAQSAGAAGNGAAAGAAGSAAGAASVDQQFAEMQQRTAETFEVLQRDQQGYATTNGLLAIVNSMRRLPGRKAVIFFSEGMALPPNVQQHFRSVINSANRANVSVYAIDAAGLRTESTLKSTRDEIERRSRTRMDTLDRAMNTPGPLTAGLERNEDLLKYDPQSGLTQLATETGGQFIGDTNKIAPKLKEIDEELNTYYLLTYAPTNQNYDGKFRNITVKVRRSDVEIQSRKGYYAVTPTGSSPLFYYEALPLAALNRPNPPRDFPLLSGSLNFPEAGQIGRTAIEVEVPASAFTFAEDREKKIYSTDFSIVALIRDQAKQVVDKLSYHYVLVGALKSLDATKKGKILFYRETKLPPGKYEIEAVAYDALNNKASVSRTKVEVPDADETRLRLSSVSIIQRAEQLKEKMDSPFVVADQLLVYPNLGEPVHKSAKQMGFYFNVYPAKGTPEIPKLTLEVWQGSKALASVALKLTAPDKQGRIQYASALPLESLSPGSYELRISVSDAKGTVSRSAAFTLEP
ncbi:MAG TPA: VWA domain-containing protein [Blastocatellia bacterium]|nr:VWA domain-containing protein [Blastocatellia bacterium]